MGTTRNRTLPIACVLILFGCAMAAGGGAEGNSQIQALTERARTTTDADELAGAIKELVSVGSKKALSKVKDLLTTEERLRVLCWIKNSANAEVRETRIFDILQHVTESLDDAKTSNLFAHLLSKPEFNPLKRRWEPGFSYELYLTVTYRRDALVLAARGITEPSKKLIALIKELAMGDMEPRKTLAALGTREAVDAYKDIVRQVAEREPGASLYMILDMAEFRDRPEVFRFLVDAYVQQRRSTVYYMTAERLVSEMPPLPTKITPLPPYETIPGKHAAFYVEQIDRVLAHKPEKPVPKEEIDKLRETRQLLAEKAEQYEKQQNEQKEAPELKGADAE